MAKQRRIPGDILNEIRASSELAAKRYSQPAHLVYKVMTRLLTDYECVENGVTLTFSAPLYHLLQYIPAKRILNVLKYDGHESFTELASYSLYLEDPTTPLYSPSDLRRIIPSFRSHLIEGTESLEKTGYPHKRFKQSPWLDALLNKLYFVKWPRLVTRTHGKLNYSWSHQVAVTGTLRSCNYASADFMLVFKKNNAQRLETMRRRLHQIKLSIFAILSDALHASSLDKLWLQCTEEFSRSLTRSEMAFLIRMDKHYAKCRLVGPQHIAHTSLVASGGILDMFQLIHDVELELRLETFSSIIEQLGDTVNPLSSRGPRIHAGKLLGFLMFQNKRVRSSFPQQVKGILHIRERSSNEITHKMNHFLKSGFGGIRVLNDKAELAYPGTMRSHSAHQAETGASQDKSCVNTFRREGELWKVCFGNITNRYRHLKGLSYIHFLLRNPSSYQRPRQYHVLDLILLVEGHIPGAITTSLGTLTDEQFVDIDIRKGAIDRPESLVDRRTMVTIRNRKQFIRGRLNAGDYEDPAIALKLREELDALNKYLQAVTKLRGKLRNDTKSAERARVSTTMTITKAIDKLGRFNHHLWIHLKRSIQTGTFVQYLPAEPTHWVL